LAGLEIIGAGFGRTGTTSLKHALEYLGYRCYHMEEVARNYEQGHIEFWRDKYNGEKERSYDDVFKKYRATVDFPACTYYRDLMAAYPDAKVLLSVRDSEGWWKSFDKLMRVNASMRWLIFIPPVRRFYRLVGQLKQEVFGGEPDRDRYIRVYEEHNAKVQAEVPPEKLLVWDVKDGWEPICEWLGVDVPEIPFPHSNAGMDDIKAKIRAGALGFFLKPFGYKPEKAWDNPKERAVKR
jgi:hypothetical protein